MLSDAITKLLLPYTQNQTSSFGRACVFLHSHRRKEKPWSMLPRAANTNSAVTKWGEQRWNWWKALLRDLAVALVLSSCCVFNISTEFLKDLSGCGCVARDEPITPKTAHMIHFNFPLADQSYIRLCHVNKRLLKQVPEVQKAFWTPIGHIIPAYPQLRVLQLRRYHMINI